jgi:hypothetical protein
MKWFEQNYASKLTKEKIKIKVLDVGSYSVKGSYRDIFTKEGGMNILVST